MLLSTTLYVVGADAVTKGLAEGRVPWPLVGNVAATAAVLTLIVRRARRAVTDDADIDIDEGDTSARPARDRPRRSV